MSVEVEVRSQLSKIVEDLERITKSAQGVSNTLKEGGENVGKSIQDQTKKTNNALSAMGQFGRRVADQLRQDFMSLGSLSSLTAGLKLSEQFGGSVKEAVTLSDTVRRLGSVFGLARQDFSSFQTLLQRGLGEIGASSEAASNALKGLAETPVRGQANLLAYAKTAAELASIGGEKGQEGTIAKGAAGIITSRGGNVNDIGQLSEVSKEILQIRQATGKSVTEITSALSGIYSKTNKDFQSALKGGGSTSLAAASLIGGPQATAFIEKYLSMDRIQRKGLEAQGFKNIVGANGELNTKAILATMQEAKGRGLGDAQAGLKTFGIDPADAQGFIRLADAIKQSGSVINGAHNAQVNLNDEYRKSMSLGDSFRANINKVKSFFSPAISAVSQGATDLLGKSSQSTAGAVGVAGGAAVLAAVLTGGGLRGIGGSLLGGLSGEAKAKAMEAATGEKVQKVQVINFPANFGGGIPGAAATGGLGLLGKAGLVGAAGAAGYGLGTLVNDYGPTFKGKTSEGFEGGLVERLFFKLDKLLGGEGAKNIERAAGITKDVNVKVSMATKDLKAATLPGRGASQ